MTFTYEGARWSTEVYGCQPGAKALLAYAHELGFADKGCFNDRGIRGSTSKPSLHREGRAVDLWWGDGDWTAFDAFIKSLVDHHEALGVQQVLWSRRAWTVGGQWHHYTGPAGTHEDHAHVELTWSSALHTTIEHIRSVLAPKSTEDDSDMLIWDCDEGGGRSTAYWFNGKRVISLFELPVLHWMLGHSGKVPYGGVLPVDQHNRLMARLQGAADPEDGQVGTWPA
jgi:hypothetical protein